MTNNKTVSKKRRKFRTSKSKIKVKINRRSKRKTKTNIKRKSTKRKYRKKKIMKGGGGIESFKDDPEKYYTHFKIGDTLTKDKLKSLFNVSYIGDGDTQVILFREIIRNQFYLLSFEDNILTLYKNNVDTEKLERVWEIITTEDDKIENILVYNDNILTM